MRRSVLAFAALLAAIAPWAAQARSTPAGMRTATVFGRGPELHLWPSVAPLGQAIQAVGLGYQPGAHARIIYGAPNAEFLPVVLARAVVRRDGTFRTTFRIRCLTYMTPSPTARPRCVQGTGGVVVGAFEGGSFATKDAATTVFIISSA